MTPNKPNLVKEIEVLAKEHFAARPFIACTYGSYATGEQHNFSDLDIFFATEDVDADDVSILSRRIIQFHDDRGLSLDEEVPFGNKLIVSYEDLWEAVSLRGLEVAEDSIYVPPVIKEPVFLNSVKVRYRLLFNALTSPHFFGGTDQASYDRYTAKAENNLYVLAVSLVSGQIAVDVDTLLEGLLCGPHGEEGEMFLGYKRNTRTLNHLRKILEAGIDVDQRKIA